MILNSKILVILGPTATGKSALAIELAKKFNGEIVSADSRQVYKGLNIGTGKVTKKEMEGIPHHLLDVANPKSRFSVVMFQELAREKISEIFSRGHLPIICGGTGFYIEAITDNITLPEVPPNENLRAELKYQSTESLLRTLEKLDSSRAKTIDSKNPRRIIRAIEIATALGAVPKIIKQEPPYTILKIGLTLPSEDLKNKITIRLFARLPRRSTGAKGGINQNMVAEAKRLHTGGLTWKRMNELGLEYRYLSLHLQDKLSKDEMTKQLQSAIWQYARRQMTWFRRDKSIKWFSPNNKAQIDSTVKNFI